MLKTICSRDPQGNPTWPNADSTFSALRPTDSPLKDEFKLKWTQKFRTYISTKAKIQSW